jgi:hypothetical protein
MAELGEDLSFIKNVKEWPAYPFLPVKRAGMRTLSDENFGVVFAKGQFPVPAVLLMNLFAIDERTDFDKVEKIKYNSIEELLLEWVVD